MFHFVAKRTVSKPALVSGTSKFIAVLQTRGMASGGSIDKAAQKAGEAKNTSPENPSVISSAGAIGKQFNPDGNVGQIGEKMGGPFSKDGAIGRQFDASKDGLASKVEKAVDGPQNPASDGKNIKVNTTTSPGSQR